MVKSEQERNEVEPPSNQTNNSTSNLGW